MKQQTGKTFPIVLTIIAILVVGILAAIYIPAFDGMEAKSNEKAAVRGLRNLLTAAIAHSEAESDSPPPTGMSGMARPSQPAAIVSSRKICDGTAGKTGIPNRGFIRKSFEFSCPEKVVIYMSVSSRAAFVSAAHANGPCIWIGHSVGGGGFARLNTACGERAPDWTGPLQDSVLSAALDKALTLSDSN